MTDYSPEATELYNFTVNESALHTQRQSAANLSTSKSTHLRSLAVEFYSSITFQASRAYPGGECFTTEHILEAALMLHREDMKAVAEDRLNGGKGEL